MEHRVARMRVKVSEGRIFLALRRVQETYQKNALAKCRRFLS